MYTPPRPMPAPPRNKALVPCAIACGCFLLALIVIGVITANMVRSTATEITQAETGADQFLTTLEKPDNQAAFDMMSAQVHNAKTVDNISDTMEVLAKHHGHPVSHLKQPGFFINNDNGMKSIRFGYQEKFEKGEVPVQIILVQEQKQWKVVSFIFQP